MGGEGGGTNPEQLFAVGYAACFEGALGAVARREKLEVGDVEIDSRVSLIPADDRTFQIGVELDVTLPSVPDDDQAVALVRAAHKVCPYSNATRGNVDVVLTANGAPVEHDEHRRRRVGTPPEGHYTRDRAKPEFWRNQRPPALAAAAIGIVVLILIVVILLSSRRRAILS